MLVYLGVSFWAILLGTRVYRYDLYDKAPRPMLLAALAAGYAAMWVLSDLEDWTSHTCGIALSNGAGRAIVAATQEEFSKLAIVICLALACRRRFRDPMDGLVYGAFAGLGMAIEESMFYMSLRANPGIEVLGAEAVRLLLHVLLGGLSAFAIGMAAARMKGWLLAMALWWTAAAGLHFLWDFCVAMPPTGLEWSAMATRLAAAALVLTTVALFGSSVLLASRWSREIFDPGNPGRLWGWPFVRNRGPQTAGFEMRGAACARRPPSVAPAITRRVAA